MQLSFNQRARLHILKSLKIVKIKRATEGKLSADINRKSTARFRLTVKAEVIGCLFRIQRRRTAQTKQNTRQY